MRKLDKSCCLMFDNKLNHAIWWLDSEINDHNVILVCESFITQYAVPHIPSNSWETVLKYDYESRLKQTELCATKYLMK